MRKVARLARVAVSEAETVGLTVELDAILTYVQELEELPTDQVPPTAHVLELTNVLRDDFPQTTTERAALLQMAPDHDGGYFRVPKVVDKDAAAKGGEEA